MGRFWERLIKTTRNILNGLVKKHGKSLDNEFLHTLLVEVESIVNSRPMTAEAISNVKSDILLWQANLLTMKSKVILPPPRCFSSVDIYCRKRFRHIANEFWSEWHKEFLRALQEIKTCKTRRRKFQIGNIVLLKVETHWNHQPVAFIIETLADKHGVVQTVRLKLGLNATLNKNWSDQ